MDKHLRSDFIQRLRPPLLARLQTQGIPLDDAEDALQEALLRLSESLPALGPDSSFPRHEQRLYAWLTTTARRVLLDERRHTKPTLSLSYECPTVARLASGYDMTEVIHQRLIVEQAWRTLGENDRCLLLLKAEGNDCGTIARRYGLREEALKKRVQRARNRFFKGLRTAGMEIRLLK